MKLINQILAVTALATLVVPVIAQTSTMKPMAKKPMMAKKMSMKKPMMAKKPMMSKKTMMKPMAKPMMKKTTM